MADPVLLCIRLNIDRCPVSRIVLILGTDHRFQMRSPEFTTAQHQRFAAFVLATAKDYDVAALAEENDPEALAEKDLVESTIQFIARELGIKHCHCDPDTRTRAALGIRQEGQIRLSHYYLQQPTNSRHRKPLTEEEVQQRMDESDRKREHYWLSKLVEFNTWPVLFVCGAEHSLPFCDLLQKNSLDTVLVAYDWST